ncbi:MAG: hypothetical protein RBQ91_03280 [Acholeplasma sp.]|nr:hypothetical protein [Acholeplasma sp.]
MIDQKAIKNKIYNQARDLEVALYNVFFENDSKEMAVMALSLFQNEDGGFHGLEPDLTNPNSTPFQTSYALELLTDIGFDSTNQDEFTKEIIERAFDYLDQTIQIDRWPLTVPTNNEFSSAIWWKHRGDEQPTFNPTASILASILVLTNKDSVRYHNTMKMAHTLIMTYMETITKDKHDLICLARLYFAVKDLIDGESFKDKLFNEIRASIDPVDLWEGYATMPFDYPIEPTNYGIDSKTIDASIAYLEKNFKGSYWEINWNWMNEDEGFDVQSFKWHGIIAIKYLRFFQANK